MNKNIAIIPARGGSKRIPRKNIKPFNGIPILGYSIKAALDSGLFHTVMVSTDDIEIKHVAESLGAKVPFFRSAKASDDYAPIMDVLEDVFSAYKERTLMFDHCCCILATAPLIQIKDIQEAYTQLLSDASLHAVVPVAPFSYPIQRALKIENGIVSMVLPENINVRSNDLEPRFHDAGQFFWVKASECAGGKSIFSMRCKPIILGLNQVQDIDTEEDWVVAEYKYSLMKSNKEFSTSE